MAEEQEVAESQAIEQEQPKKKGSKLPIVIVLVVMLVAGGFFMMKGKSSAPKKPEAPALGAIEPVKEMLVNLVGNQAYLRAEIALHLVKDFKKEEFEANKEAIQDAIIVRLKSKKLSEIQSPEQLHQLKQEIAADVNKILNREKKAEPKDVDDSEDKPAEKGSDKPADKPAEPKLPYTVPEDYDSPTGPVLKVYFTSFATQ